MADFNIDGRMKVKTLKAQFKGGEVKVVGNMKVGNFEDKIKEVFGIKVQVATKDDSALADNGLTLSAAGK